MTRDAEARTRIENDLDRSFLVEAAAGTGKTTALVGRIARMVATGRAEITQLAAITFTERASGELVLRLRERLELAREASDAEERARLDRALGDFEAAYVGTIHGFCAELLRAHPLPAGIDPSFVLLADDEQMELLDQTTDRFLEDALRDPPEGLRRAIARMHTGDRDGGPLRTQLAKEIRALAEHRDQDPHLSRAPFDREAAIDALVARPDVARSLARTLELERTRPRDHDRLERELVDLLASIPKKGALRTAIEAFAIEADADLAYCLARDLAPALERYDAQKRTLGVLDHLDSLLRARSLLMTSRAARVALRDRFRFLFVDEVQDVDPIQKDVVLLLSGTDPDEDDPARVRPRPGSLYLVGDPKQAIYGFRRADLRTYVALAHALVPAHAERLELSLSHRPRPAIAALVNRAFDGVFDGSAGQASHVALEAQRPAMSDFPSVIALPSPRSKSEHGYVNRKVIDAALPSAIASFVRWLLHDSGLSIEDPISHRTVPISAGHVAILFRAGFRGTALASALERFGVAHSFVAPEAFFDREIVVAASALTSAIEWPTDALSVYATLRGLLVGAPDADLLAYRERVGPLDPLAPGARAGLSNELTVIHDALTLIGALHRERHGRGIESTLGSFFERGETEVLLLLAARRGEARALDHLRQLARRADRRGATFRDFARWLADRVDDPTLGGVDLTPDTEPLDAVTLLTAHRAKGLEFPVVVIADPTARPQRYLRSASRYTDPERNAVLREVAGFVPRELRARYEMADTIERAESARILYVAATRARDVLVVPTIGEGAIDDSWMAPLTHALVPADPREEVSTLPRLPSFGDRSVLDDGARTEGVRPGHHAAHLDGVTWWDPRSLASEPPAHVPHGLTHLVARGAERSAIDAEAERDRETERSLRDAALGAIDARSARRLARMPLGATFGSTPITLIELGAPALTGARFAKLVARMAREPIPDARRAAHHARIVGATDAERDAALDAIRRFRAEATVASLLASAEARADVPYLFATDAGPVAWGRAAWVVPAGEALAVVDVTVGADVDAARVELAMAVGALGIERNRAVRGYLACLR